MIGAVLLAAAPAVWADDTPDVMREASTNWNIHYADDYCRLARTFGTGDDALVLMMDRFAPGDTFRITLVGEPTKIARQGGEAKIRFGPDMPEQSLKFFSGTLNGGVPMWIFSGSVGLRPIAVNNSKGDAANIPISEAEEAAVTQLRIGAPLRTPVVLHMGSLKEPFAALRVCTDELLTHWGIDVDRHRQMTQAVKPIGSPGDWLTYQDYPSSMLKASKSGLVNFRLTVDERGKPIGCSIQKSTKPEGFDKAVCDALMRRARFEPARDAEGKPLVSFYINSVHFQTS